MIAILAAGAAAQVNADILASRVTVPGPAFGLAGTFGLSTGNVRSISWGSDAAAQYLTLHDAPPGPPPFFRDRALIVGSLRRAAYDREVVESEGLVHARYTRMWVPRVGTEAFAQLQYDRFLLLERRALAGGGLRVDVVHRERVGAWGGTGAMFEHETLADGVRSAVVRSTSYTSVSGSIVPERMSALITAYVQPRIDRPEDLRVLVEGGLDAEVGSAFSLGAALAIRHDSRPPASVDPTDLRLGTTVKLRLGARAEAP